MNKELIIRATAAGVGAGLGFGVGWVIAKRRFATFADLKVAEVKEHYAQMYQDKPDLADLSAKYEEELEEEARLDQKNTPAQFEEFVGKLEQYVSPDVLEVDVTQIDPVNAERQKLEVQESLQKAQNVFEDYGNNDPEVIVVEVEEPERSVPEVVRSAEHPYIISAEEFFEEDSDEYTKLSFAYWEADDVLADDGDMPVDDLDGNIGDALSHFGELSQDKDIVYVRNDRLKNLYEVTRDERSFGEVIVGIRPDRNVIGKMRDND